MVVGLLEHAGGAWTHSNARVGLSERNNFDVCPMLLPLTLRGNPITAFSCVVCLGVDGSLIEGGREVESIPYACANSVLSFRVRASHRSAYSGVALQNNEAKLGRRHITIVISARVEAGTRLRKEAPALFTSTVKRASTKQYCRSLASPQRRLILGMYRLSPS